MHGYVRSLRGVVVVLVPVCEGSWAAHINRVTCDQPAESKLGRHMSQAAQPTCSTSHLHPQQRSITQQRDETARRVDGVLVDGILMGGMQGWMGF